jgi:hypothetical protein
MAMTVAQLSTSHASGIIERQSGLSPETLAAEYARARAAAGIDARWQSARMIDLGAPKDLPNSRRQRADRRVGLRSH